MRVDLVWTLSSNTQFSRLSVAWIEGICASRKGKCTPTSGETAAEQQGYGEMEVKMATPV